MAKPMFIKLSKMTKFQVQRRSQPGAGPIFNLNEPDYTRPKAELRELRHGNYPETLKAVEGLLSALSEAERIAGEELEIVFTDDPIVPFTDNPHALK